MLKKITGLPIVVCRCPLDQQIPHCHHTYLITSFKYNIPVSIKITRRQNLEDKQLLVHPNRNKNALFADIPQATLTGCSCAVMIRSQNRQIILIYDDKQLDKIKLNFRKFLLISVISLSKPENQSWRMFVQNKLFMWNNKQEYPKREIGSLVPITPCSQKSQKLY